MMDILRYYNGIRVTSDIYFFEKLKRLVSIYEKLKVKNVWP